MAARERWWDRAPSATSAAPSISFMPKPPPAVNTGNTVRCEVSLASIVVVMVQPLSSEASASLATSVLPRRMPCWSGNDSRMISSFFSSTDRAQALRRFLLLVGPQRVTRDKTQRVTPSMTVVIARSDSDEAIHTSVRAGYGLLRGACHRAALCADPLARNDGGSAITRPPTNGAPWRRSLPAPAPPTARRAAA